VTKQSPVRVGIVAADPLRSLGLVAILEEALGAEVVPVELEAVFADAPTDAPIDALLLDSRSSLDGLTDLIARLRKERPTVKLVAMGPPLDPEDVQAIIGAGAKGYLAETAGESEIRMAMEVVLDGSIWAPRKVLARLIDAGGAAAGAGTAASGDSIEQLMTPREQDVLQLLMEGRSNRDIALAMGIDEVTVKAHLGRMLRKTRSSNRVELTLRAIEERSARTRPPSR
jgi:DNA-binding NarL/FixJ family response regulator